MLVILLSGEVMFGGAESVAEWSFGDGSEVERDR